LWGKIGEGGGGSVIYCGSVGRGRSRGREEALADSRTHARRGNKERKKRKGTGGEGGGKGEKKSCSIIILLFRENIPNPKGEKKGRHIQRLVLFLVGGAVKKKKGRKQKEGKGGRGDE